MSLRIQSVSKVFDGFEQTTLSEIDLCIEDGEFICIVGPSGCGKSTLLNLVAGLEYPSSGKLYMDDIAIDGPGKDRVVLFQESALYPWLNVYENVMLGMKLAKVPIEERAARAEKYLKMVHLWNFRNYAVHEISGGMKQRAALARALSLDSRMLLMDEPFSALDKQTIHMLRRELEEIWEKTGRTILFVTHSVEEAIYFANRIIVFSESPGRIKEVVPVNLPRPRDIEGEEFIAIRRRLLALIREEMERNAGKEYDQND